MAARNNVRNFIDELPLNPATLSSGLSVRCSVSRLSIFRTTLFPVRCSELDSPAPLIRYPPEHPLPRPAAETHPPAHAPDTPPIPSSRRTSTSATDTPPHSPSIHPCPSGPCRCGHTLSSADNSPFTFARQIATPSTSASATCPTAGASANPHNRTHFANRKFSVISMLEPPLHERFTAASSMLKSTQKPDAPPHSQARQAPHLNPLHRTSSAPSGSSKPSPSPSSRPSSAATSPSACSSTRANGSSSCTQPAPPPARNRSPAFPRTHPLRPRRIRHPATHRLVDPRRPRRPLRPHHHPLPPRRQRLPRRLHPHPRQPPRPRPQHLRLRLPRLRPKRRRPSQPAEP